MFDFFQLIEAGLNVVEMFGVESFEMIFRYGENVRIGVDLDSWNSRRLKCVLKNKYFISNENNRSLKLFYQILVHFCPVILALVDYELGNTLAEVYYIQLQVFNWFFLRFFRYFIKFCRAALSEFQPQIYRDFFNESFWKILNQ